MDAYRKQTLSTTMPLSQETSGWYCETTISNQTASTIFVMRPGGQIDEIAPLYVGRGFGQDIVLRQVVKVGLPVKDTGLLTGQHTAVTPKYPLTEIVLDVRKLSTGPLFIPDIGVTLCLAEHSHRLKEMNYLDPTVRSKTISQTCSEYLRNGLASPLTILANCHDKAIDFFYVEINGRVMSVNVKHDYDLPEMLQFKVTRNASVTNIPFENLNWTDFSVHEAVIFNRTWIMGTDLEAVHKRAHARYRAELSKRTPAEVQTEVEEATADLKTELEEKTKRIDNLTQELKLLKQELTNTKNELDKANSSYQLSYEQEQLKAKLDNLEAERRLLGMKRDIQQEEARLAAEQNKVKAAAEQEATQAKVEKERLHLQEEKLSVWATVVKTLAVIIPVIVSGTIWLMKHKVVPV